MTDHLVASAARVREPLHYRVDVLAGSVADVVRGSGGWIFDRTMQGWAVNVLISQPCDTRPLEILGATVNEPQNPDHPAPQVFLEADDVAGFEFVEHRLSVAARHFKAQALIAADLAPSQGNRLAMEVIAVQAVTPVFSS